MEPHAPRTITSILPTTAWASLPDVIVRETPRERSSQPLPTPCALNEQALARVGRTDVPWPSVHLRGGEAMSDPSFM